MPAYSATSELEAADSESVVVTDALSPADGLLAPALELEPELELALRVPLAVELAVVGVFHFAQFSAVARVRRRGNE